MVTHKEFITELANKLGWTQTKVSEVMDATVDVVTGKLSEDIQISIQNFGIFETRKKMERISTNPQTQQRYLVPPSIVAVFKPSVNIKEQLKNIRKK